MVKHPFLSNEPSERNYTDTNRVLICFELAEHTFGFGAQKYFEKLGLVLLNYYGLFLPFIVRRSLQPIKVLSEGCIVDLWYEPFAFFSNFS